MKKFICFMTITALLLLSSCTQISLIVSDPELDDAVEEMFVALVDGDEEAQKALYRSDAVYQENVSVEGTVKDIQPLARNVEISDGVTQKDARYQIETESGIKYIVLVRYIIDDNEEGFYQYTIAKK